MQEANKICEGWRMPVSRCPGLFDLEEGRPSLVRDVKNQEKTTDIGLHCISLVLVLINSYRKYNGFNFETPAA